MKRTLIVSVAVGILAAVGTATAASLITSADIKNNTVQSKDIKNRTIQTKDMSGAAKRALKGNTGPQGLQGPQGPIGPQGPAGTNGTNGTNGAPATKLWAVISSGGTPTVSRSSGGVTVSYVNSVGQSQYQVKVPQDVRSCAYVATPGNEGAISQTEVVTPADVTVAQMSADANGVAVTTYTADGSSRVASGFHLAVFC